MSVEICKCRGRFTNISGDIYVCVLHIYKCQWMYANVSKDLEI